MQTHRYGTGYYTYTAKQMACTYMYIINHISHATGTGRLNLLFLTPSFGHNIFMKHVNPLTDWVEIQ
jgi:hypothetical protein